MQAFINQAEGRWRIDTASSAAPGRVPEPIAAAQHLASRQAERDEFEAAVRAAVAASRAADAAQALQRQVARRNALATLLRDAASALVVMGLLTFCLTSGQVPVIS